MGNSVSRDDYNRDMENERRRRIEETNRLTQEAKDRKEENEKLRHEAEQRYRDQRDEHSRQFDILIASNERNTKMLIENQNKQTAQMIAALNSNKGGQLQLTNSGEGKITFFVLYKEGTGKNEKLKSIPVKCNRQDTIKHIKSVIEFEHKIPVKNQKLVFNGKELEDGTIQGAGIGEGSKVMFYRLKN